MASLEISVDTHLCISELPPVSATDSTPFLNVLDSISSLLSCNVTTMVLLQIIPNLGFSFVLMNVEIFALFQSIG